MELKREATTFGPQILKELNVLHAIYWVICAWKDTSPDTIMKCFINCGFQSDTPVLNSESDADDEDELPLIMHKLAKYLFGCDVNDLIQIDKDFHTCDNDLSSWDRSVTEILGEGEESESDIDEDVTERHEENDKSLRLRGICVMSAQIQKWAIKNGHSDVVQAPMELRNCVGNTMMTGDILKQKKISDFFIRK